MKQPDDPEGAPARQPAGSDLHRWVAQLIDELGVDPDAVDVDAVLDVAREAAHGVARPAVPLTGFLLGYAVGAGAGDRDEFVRLADRVVVLARAWAADREGTGK